MEVCTESEQWGAYYFNNISTACTNDCDETTRMERLGFIIRTKPQKISFELTLNFYH